MPTVIDQQPFNEYTGNGVTTVYAYEFQLLQASDLVVKIDDVVTTDFVLVGIGNQAGGTVTFNTAPANGANVLLSREMLLERDTDYQEQGDLLADAVNKDYNRLWLALQQQRATIGGAVRAPFPEQLPELPAPEQRKGLLLGFDSVTGVLTLVAGAVGSVVAFGLQLASAIGSSLIGFLNAGVGAVRRTVQSKLRETISPLDFGAIGDGSENDTAALMAAEAAAFATGLTLFFPPGTTYLFNGTFTTRVSIQGYGATIRQSQPSVGVNITKGVVAAGANNIIIAGLTVDGGLKTSGFTSDGFSYLTYRDCYAINCVNLGFGNYAGTRIDLWACRATNTRYQSTGTPSLPADGFYFGGCTRSRWIGCSADDFRRIGFVSEGNGGTKSAQIQALFCLASNANNCDDSTTEYNAGFWAENTNSIDWLYCIASDIATGVGQTSGRVVGMIPMALGNNSRGNVNVIGCRVFGGTNYLPIAMQISGSGTFADLNIQDCYLNRAQTGVTNLCGFNSLTIRNMSMEDVVNVNSGNGGIVINASAGGLLPVFEIDKLTATSVTWDANSGIVNFFSAPLACNYTLRNVKGGHPHVMRGRVAKLRAEECVIVAGATGYSSFLAGDVSFVDCDFTSRNNATTDQIVSAGALASGSTVMFRGGSVTGYGAGWAPDFSGTNVTTRCFGTKFDNYCWDISTTGTFDNEFNDCLFLNVPPTVGSVRTNTAAATKQVLSIQGGKAKSNNAADIPFRKRAGGADPTVLVIQGVGNTSGTTLHNFTNGAPAVANNYTF